MILDAVGFLIKFEYITQKWPILELFTFPTLINT